MNARDWKQRLSLGLVLLPAAAVSARSMVTVNTGYNREEYSFTTAPGWAQWTQVAADFSPASNWGVSAGQSAVRRFGFTDHQGTLGATAKLGRATGLEAKVSVSPGAEVLPRFLTDWTLTQGLSGGLSLAPAYRYSHYPTADAHMLAAGADWEKNASLAVTARVYLTLTQFKGGGAERLTPAVLALAKLAPVSSLRASPSYAYRKESFQSGAPGGFGSGEFSAHTLRLELRWMFRKNCFASGAWGYESRIPAAVLRQYELGLGIGF